MNRFFLAILFFLALANCSVAQSGTDEELAQQYYLDKKYDMAAPYYEKIYAHRQSNMVYHNYLICLVETKDYKTAEKLIKKQMKQEPDNLSLWIDMGNTYSASGDEKSADESYEKAIHNLPADRSQILALGQSFYDIKKWDYALETYKKGKELLKNAYPFLFEMGAVYKAKGDLETMVDTYLDALVLSESYLQAVQDALQVNVDQNADAAQYTVIRKELLKYVQKYSDNDVFSQFLIWMLMQQHNYADAMVQVKALDRRRHEGGERMMELASTCMNNEAYDYAIQAYQYVLDIGPKGVNYEQAKQEQLRAMYLKITTGSYTQEQLLTTQKKLRQGLDEMPRNYATVPLMTELANLDAFYLHDDSEAITLMNDAVALPGLPTVTRDRCKMALGDILLASGQIWEASLTYSQVETELKHEPLGDEAKLKNATIYYYTGNFTWAKAQLDILKGATDKLTANDAMALSLVIADNTDDSTHLKPIYLFAHAQYLDFCNHEDSVEIYLDSVYNMTNTRTLKEQILMMRAHMAEKRGDDSAAMKYYRSELSDYPDGMLPDKALYKMAEMEDKKLNDLNKASEYYKQLILNYPGSLYIEEVRERYRHLVKDDAPPVN